MSDEKFIPLAKLELEKDVSGYGTLKIYFCYRDGNDQHYFRLFSPWQENATSKVRLAGLEISGQYNVGEWRVYAYDFNYNVGKATEENVAELSVGLKTLRKGYDRIVAEWGAAADWGTYAMRLLKVLGVEKFLTYNSALGWMENHYTDLPSVVKGMIENHKAEVEQRS